MSVGILPALLVQKSSCKILASPWPHHKSGLCDAHFSERDWTSSVEGTLCLHCVFYVLFPLGHLLPGQQHSEFHPFIRFFFLSDLPWWLILIRQKALVGKLPGDHEVCKVTKIAVLSLSEMEPQELELEVSWHQRTVAEMIDVMADLRIWFSQLWMLLK